MATRSSPVFFIFIFITALVALMFAPEISSQVDDVQTAINDSTSLEHTLYGYIPAFYALCCIGIMIGSMIKIFKS